MVLCFKEKHAHNCHCTPAIARVTVVFKQLQGRYGEGWNKNIGKRPFGVQRVWQPDIVADYLVESSRTISKGYQWISNIFFASFCANWRDLRNFRRLRTQPFWSPTPFYCCWVLEAGMQSGDVRRIAGFIDMEKLFCFAVCICLSRTKTFQSHFEEFQWRGATFHCNEWPLFSSILIWNQISIKCHSFSFRISHLFCSPFLRREHAVCTRLGSAASAVARGGNWFWFTWWQYGSVKKPLNFMFATTCSWHCAGQVLHSFFTQGKGQSPR